MFVPEILVSGRRFDSMVPLQCFLLALFTLLGGYSVYIHDQDSASDSLSENAFLAFGHFDALLIEDSLVIVLLLVAGIAPQLLSVARARQLRILALSLVAAILMIEFFSELGIACSENQRLLSSSGKLTRVLAVLSSSGGALWAGILACALYCIEDTSQAERS